MSIFYRVMAFAALFSTSMLAQAEQAAPGPNPAGQWIMLAGFGLVFYFLIWRPQSKRQKAHQTLISSLEEGDEVVTSGGLIGQVQKVSDSFVVLSLSDGVQVRLQKQAVASAVPKGTLKSSI